MEKQTPLKVVVLASGTGTLLQAIMDAAGPSAGFQVVAVVSDKHCPAIERAAQAGLPTQVVPMSADRQEWNRALAEAVAQFAPDVVVSAGFMRILGKPFLDKFEGRTINTHPSLLPAFPGADAVGDALGYGVKVTGCTVHYVDAGTDTGEIIAQRAVAVADGDTKDSLHERIKQQERDLIVDVLSKATLENGKANFNGNCN